MAEEIAADTVPHPETDHIVLQGQVIKRSYPIASVRPLTWEPKFIFLQPEVEPSCATVSRAMA
ncbi:hypothetical protein [Paraburkholderia sp. HP33-1]|uniref:hypothetical protein n=1 Tax=Paraburkholderia sp. HP33-1 TaxID=2883243 RepID=UPI001F27F3D3|nr:hypothetical protein [Paraburkholderia sp. HP33-1]